MKASKKRGFTIVELIIVIAVIAILAAVLIPTFSNLISRANESVDIQAARNMNTFLATAKYTSGVSSILDVYDVFEESGFKVENYSPLYKGRHYYYDIGYNQILYVDDNGKVLYPEEHKDMTKDGRSWCSLSMETMKVTNPSEGGGSYKQDNNTITATVKSAEQYAYVVDEYNKNKSSSPDLNLTIDGEIDMMGASCTFGIIDEKNGGTITVSGTNGAVLKNVTSNETLAQNTQNAAGTLSKYYSSALFSSIEGSGANITISNITFENLNVKTTDGGNVGLLFGSVSANNSVTLENVKIKNSTVVGHRNTAALIGQMDGNLTIKDVELDNVTVKTVGGRSALLVVIGDGCKSITGMNTLKMNDWKLEIYKCKSAEQKFSDAKEIPTEWGTPASTTTLTEQEKLIYSFKGYNKADGTKEYSAYGFNRNALAILQTTDDWTVFTTIDGLKNFNGQQNP